MPTFKINPEPFPLQQKHAYSRRRTRRSPSRPPSARREKHRDESSFQQHSVGLISREFSRRRDKRKKAHETNKQHSARPEIQRQQQRRDHSNPAPRHQHRRAGGKPRQGWSVKISGTAVVRRDLCQIMVCGENSVGSDQSANLEYQREKRREINQSQRAQHNPSRYKFVARPHLGIQQPASDGSGSPLYFRVHRAHCSSGSASGQISKLQSSAPTTPAKSSQKDNYSRVAKHPAASWYITQPRRLRTGTKLHRAAYSYPLFFHKRIAAVSRCAESRGAIICAQSSVEISQRHINRRSQGEV